MLTLFEKRPRTRIDRARDWIGAHRLITAAAAAALFLLGLAAYGYQVVSYMQRPDPDFDTRVERPSYATEHPRVLFDAAHLNVHTATGNYRPFAELVRHDGYDVAGNAAAFSAASLAGARVLVIVNPLGWKGVAAMLLNLAGLHRALRWDLDAFRPQECDAVRDWVMAGGGLLLIADHAPAGSAARALATRFGVDMSNAFTEDDRNSDPDAYGWLRFTRANGLLLTHPVTDGREAAERVDSVTTFTGQSLLGPPGSVAFLSLASTARDYPTRESTLADGRSAAGRAQGIAFTCGRGRVVVLGEAAMLSAQVFHAAGRTLRLGMEYPGCDNRRLALNIMHWLSGLSG